jgi:hypothetical protein
MKLKEIRTGIFFTIDNTPSYPKLRTDYGYIDARDEIKKECEDLEWDLTLMTTEQVLEQFKDFGFKTVDDIGSLKMELLKK